MTDMPPLETDRLLIRPFEQGDLQAAHHLFYAIAPVHRRQGYAFEAARALVDYAFLVLRLKRVVATITYENLASMAVMQKLGMHIAHNPFPDPPYLQVVGVISNTSPAIPI